LKKGLGRIVEWRQSNHDTGTAVWTRLFVSLAAVAGKVCQRIMDDVPESPPPEVVAWVIENPTAALVAGSLCLTVSASLILRIWCGHRRTPIFRRLFWSAVVLVPLLGWLLYASCFNPPVPEDGIQGGGSGGWGNSE
jgi:integral membrane sensor domain MASE1